MVYIKVLSFTKKLLWRYRGNMMVYGNFMVRYKVILYTMALKFMYFSIYVALHGTAKVYVQNTIVFVM